jgi:outer membrane protein TolC
MLRHRTAARLLPALLLLFARPAGAAEAGDEALPPPAAATHPVLTLDLAEALRLAHDRQPRIVAQRASLAAAEDGQRALASLRFPATLEHELPVRRHQAALGVTAATAALDRAEHEAIYAVTRTYFTVLYAREQEKLAGDVIDQLSAIHENAQQQVKAGAKDITNRDVQRTLVYLRLAQARRVQAAQGVKRALAALAEAIGLEPEACLDVPAGRLPSPGVRPCLGDVVAAALARRAEIVQTNIFAEVAALEVDAQATGHHLRMETFASGADIHAQPVPQGVHDDEYRPGANPPQMPDMLAGPRPSRMKTAQSYSARAAAVAEETRNLLALEARNAFYRWEEASQQASHAHEAADTGKNLADGLNKDYIADPTKKKLEDLVTARVLASQARSQYNEYLFRLILALADLQRVTAGAFCAGLAPAPATEPQPAKAKDSGEKPLFP